MLSQAYPIAFGRYTLTERLAVGGMAELFLAKVAGAHGFNKTVVIKRILPHLSADAELTSMFINEAKLTARLAHPKIAQTYELGREHGQLFIAMELVDGVDGLALLREHAARQTLMPAPVVVHIIHEVLDALDFAHSQTDDDGNPLGIVHRDISPSNILCSRRGDVKLVDFGIAQAFESSHRTRSGTLKGKYGYMAPEQVRGEPLDRRSDIFSVGVVLVEMLMGRRLFAAAAELDILLMVRDVNLSRLEKFGKKIDGDLLATAHHALKKNPEDRFPTAGAFRDELADWLYSQRERVTPKRVAALVGSIYDDAWAHRRDAMARAEDGGADKDSDSSPQLIEGIPAGELARQDSGPVIELIHASNRISDVELGDPGDSLEIPIVVDDQVSAAFAAIRAEDVAAQSEPDARSSYPSIAAAVSAMAPGDPDIVPPDPAEAEYDGFDATREQARKRRSRRRLRQPTQDEIAAAAKQPPPALADIKAKPDGTGDLSEIPPIHVLYRLAVGNATGLLVVRAGAVRKEIYLAGGAPTFVSSNVAEELFGAYLVAEKVLSSGELDMALAMMPSYGGKLGETLVGLGLMKPLDVFRLLSRQVKSKLVDVCTWDSGSFEWYEGFENPRQAFPLDLDPFEMLGAGAMALPESTVMSWAERVAHARPRAARNPAVSVDVLGAGDWGKRAMDVLGQTSTVWELASRYASMAERLQFLRALYLLVFADIAILDGL